MSHLTKTAKLERFPERFQRFQKNSRIFGIFQFWLQNQIRGLKLSGNDVPFDQNGQTWEIYREIPKIPKKFQNSWNYSIPNAESGWVTKVEWEKHPTLCFWPKMVELWAKSEIGRFKSAEIGRTFERFKVGRKSTDYGYVIGFWKFHPETSFLGHFVCLWSDPSGLHF